MGARIILGAELPKNWRENLAKQKDERYQEMLDNLENETDPEMEKKINREIDEYWAKRRVELGFTDPEE